MKNIKILGTGCPKCVALAENTQSAAGELGIEFEIEKVTDINDIISYGVMMTPALVIDGEVKSTGRLLTPDEIKSMLG